MDDKNKEVRKIKIQWITSDNSVFVDEEVAQDHQLLLNVRDELSNILNEDIYDEDEVFNTNQLAIIMENKDEIIRTLKLLP